MAAECGVRKRKGGDATKEDEHRGWGGGGGVGSVPTRRGAATIGTREGRQWTDCRSPVRKREEVTKSISVLGS